MTMLNRHREPSRSVVFGLSVLIDDTDDDTETPFCYSGASLLSSFLVEKVGLLILSYGY